MTQNIHTAQLIIPTLEKIPVLSCAVLLTGLLTSPALAGSNSNPAQSSNLPAKSLGLKKINYLKIPGYGNQITSYARAVTAQNSSIGTLTIRGVAALGYTLTAIPQLKTADGIKLTVDSSANQYQWYRTCDNSGVQLVPLTLSHLVDANGNSIRKKSNTRWCSISGANSFDYIIGQDDLNKSVAVAITVDTPWNQTETFISPDNISGICKAYPNFNNQPPYACSFLFESSFESID